MPPSRPIGKLSACLIAALLAAAYATGLLGTARVLAYDDYGRECHQPYSGGNSLLYAPYTNDGTYPPGTTYQPVFDAARLDWSGSATPVYFQSSSQANWTFGAKYLGANNRAGETNYTCSGPGGSMDTAYVWLNRTYTESYSTFTRQALASHEMGHMLGLGHSNYQAIMGVNDGSFNGTLSDDWCGINHVYPSNNYPPTCGY